MSYQFSRLDQEHQQALVTLWGSMSAQGRELLSYWSAEALVAELLAGNIYGAFDKSKLLAFCAARVTLDEVEILQIYVSDDSLRRGLAGFLLGNLVNLLKPQTVFLEVHEKNQVAIAFYEAKGFKQVHFREKYYSQIHGARVYCWHPKT